MGAAALAVDLGLDPLLKLMVTGNSLSRECCLSGIFLSAIMGPVGLDGGTEGRGVDVPRRDENRNLSRLADKKSRFQAESFFLGGVDRPDI